MARLALNSLREQGQDSNLHVFRISLYFKYLHSHTLATFPIGTPTGLFRDSGYLCESALHSVRKRP